MSKSNEPLGPSAFVNRMSDISRRHFSGEEHIFVPMPLSALAKKLHESGYIQEGRRGKWEMTDRGDRLLGRINGELFPAA